MEENDEVPVNKQNLLSQLPSLSRIMSVVMLMFGILAVGILFYQLMIGFFVPLFLAALLVVIFHPLHDWLLRRTKQRRRLAAGLTTALIFILVLLPIGLLVSVATTQFTIVLSRMNVGTIDAALDRIRGQFSLSLPHPQHFRELDTIIDSLGVTTSSDSPLALQQQSEQLDRAAAIITYLQSDLPEGKLAEAEAKLAIEELQSFSEQLQATSEAAHADQQPNAAATALLTLNSNEMFEQNSVKTAASIRSWMHSILGGSLRSQLRLLANPGEADFASLIRKARESLQPRFVKLTSATGSLVLQTLFGLLILVVSVYFFLIDGAIMIRTLMRLSPLDDAYEHQLLMEFDRTSRAVVLASVLSAITQGILATVGYTLAGLDQIVLLFLLTTVMSLVPFLGAASIWGPCALYLGMVEERWIAAAVLAIYGAAVVSSIDNVIKVLVLQGHSQLHPLFALLSVIGGVSVFGPIGILVGPMVVVFLQTLLEILNHELKGTGPPAPM